MMRILNLLPNTVSIFSSFYPNVSMDFYLCRSAACANGESASTKEKFLCTEEISCLVFRKDNSCDLDRLFSWGIFFGFKRIFSLLKTSGKYQKEVMMGSLRLS